MLQLVGVLQALVTLELLHATVSNAEDEEGEGEGREGEVEVEEDGGGEEGREGKEGERERVNCTNGRFVGR